MSTGAVILPPGGGEPLGSMVMKVTRPDLTLIEFDAGGDFGGAEPHFHKLHSDAFYILSGTIDFVVDGESFAGEPFTAEPFTAEPGALTFFPPEVIHSFTVGSGGARFLNSHTPGGFERYFDELRALREQGGSPDAEFYARHDIYYV
jgi:mannose-6-phosphate isomerase-like protein (cupin superfamily)